MYCSYEQSGVQITESREYRTIENTRNNYLEQSQCLKLYILFNEILSLLQIDTVNLTEDRLESSFDGVGAHGHRKYNVELDFYLPIDPEV